MYMLMKPLLLFVVTFMSSFQGSQFVGKEKIEWLTLNEVSSRMEKEPRPMIIDLYAKWCYWCKVMDKKTYNHEKVVEYINKHFYPVKFDAETKQTIQWKHQEYDFNPDVKVNEFSLYVTNGQLSFPTTVIYTSEEEAPAAIPGFMSPDEIEPILKYFGESHYKKQSFQDFLKNFKREW